MIGMPCSEPSFSSPGEILLPKHPFQRSQMGLIHSFKDDHNNFDYQRDEAWQIYGTATTPKRRSKRTKLTLDCFGFANKMAEHFL